MIFKKILLVAVLCSSCLNSAYSEPNTFLKDINKDRPVFAIGMFPGHPEMYGYGMDNGMELELDRIKGYFDPVIQIDIAHAGEVSLSGDSESKDRIAKRIQDTLSYFQKQGVYVRPHNHMAVPCGGGNIAPDWYKNGTKDWDEKNIYSGESINVPCLANPDLYNKILYPYINEIWGSVQDTSNLVGWDLESEPSQYNWGVANEPGANPHTKRLFREFLSNEYGSDIALFNKAANTHFKNFEEVDIGDKNWLVQVMKQRFQSWLLYNYYQGNVIKEFRKRFPGVPVITRWCELGVTSYDPRDASRLDEVKPDYNGFTLYPGCYYIPYCRDNRSLLGKATADLSFLRNYNRPIGLVELNRWRHSFGQDTSTFSPHEVENFLYRTVYYNVGLYSFFTWCFPSANYDWENYNFYPETLQAIRKVKDEFSAMKPYSKWGRAKPNEIGVIISRNANFFPIGNNRKNYYYFPVREKNYVPWGPAETGHYYHEVRLALESIMEDPKMSYFDLIEEHSGISEEKLSKYKGLIVYDACLENSTRETINSLAEKGKKVLVIGSNPYVDRIYRKAVIPAAYPIESVGESLQKEESYFANYDFALEETGNYSIFLAGSIPDECGTSPFYWGIDEGVLTNVTTAEKLGEYFNKDNKMCWFKLADADLSKGKHIFRFRVKEKRPAGDMYEYHLGAIAMVKKDRVDIGKFSVLPPHKPECDVWLEGGGTWDQNINNIFYPERTGYTEGYYRNSLYVNKDACAKDEDPPFEYVDTIPDKSHPVISGLDRLGLQGGSEIEPREGAVTLALSKMENKPVVVANENVVYLSGVPVVLSQRKQLYLNFLKWCGVDNYDLYVSRFEKAVVIQNFKSEFTNTRTDGRMLREYPQITWLKYENGGYQQTWEAKGDFPWLAYTDTGNVRKLEGIYMDSAQIRVFLGYEGKTQPHFRDIPAGIGFHKFMLGNTMMRGDFRVDVDGTFNFKYEPGFWNGNKVKWVLKDVIEDEIVGEGYDINISFAAKKDNTYYIELKKEQ